MNQVFIVEVTAPAPSEGAPPTETYGIVAPDRQAALDVLGRDAGIDRDARLSPQGELDPISARIFSFDLARSGQVKRIMRHHGQGLPYRQR